MSRKERMVRTIRVYEETAQLIEAFMHVQEGKKFADVVEDWVLQLYPDEYAAIQKKMELVEDMIRKNINQEDE